VDGVSGSGPETGTGTGGPAGVQGGGTGAWPTAELQPLARLQVMTAGMPGRAVVERVLPFPFSDVWAFMDDLERAIPALDATVARLRIVERRGSRLVARARMAKVPIRSTLDITLEPGWCWMVARWQWYVVGFAAEPVGDATRLVHVESLHVRGPRWLRALARPILRATVAVHRRHVAHDLDGMERALTRDASWRAARDAVRQEVTPSRPRP
jgi:hypothetical protein